MSTLGTRLAVPAGVAGALAAVWASGRFAIALPSCPIAALTGLQCPGCGTGRCLATLLDGDLAAAFAYNPLVIPALILVTAAGVSPDSRIGSLLRRRWSAAAVGAGVGLFWILRLLPIPLLAPLRA